jgi:hypothetical protein
MAHYMKLHENRELFTEAITAAALPKEEGGLGIRFHIKSAPSRVS